MVLSNRLKNENIEEYNIMKKVFIGEELYKKTSINDLIIFGIYLLNSDNKKCNFETLAHKCFTLFPKVFSLSQYPKWPDTRKLDRPIRSLRGEGMIAGSPKSSFSLTRKGRKKALEISKSFRQAKLL
jgi:hypothetical protein